MSKLNGLFSPLCNHEVCEGYILGLNIISKFGITSSPLGFKAKARRICCQQGLCKQCHDGNRRQRRKSEESGSVFDTNVRVDVKLIVLLCTLKAHAHLLTRC